MGRWPEWGKEWGKVTHVFRHIPAKSDLAYLA